MPDKENSLDKSDAIATFLGTVHGKKVLAHMLYETGLFKTDIDPTDVAANALRNYGMKVMSWLGPNINASNAFVDGLTRHIIKEDEKK